MEAGSGAARRTGQHQAGSAERRGLVEVMNSAAQIGTLGVPGQQDLVEQSPVLHLYANPNY